jgi:hypothetical protein
VGIRVATLVKKHGKEKTIEVLDTYKFPMMTTTHFEYAEMLKRAKCLIKEGKLDELEELDKKLEELEHYDLWD